MQVLERNSRVYTEEENAFIEEYAGIKTLDWIAKELKRGPEGVRVQMANLGVNNIRLETGAYSANSLAKATGVSNETVRRWIRKGLKVTKKSKRTGVHRENKQYYIFAEDFWGWARKHTDYIEFNKISKNSIVPEPAWVDLERKRQFHNMPKQQIWATEEDNLVWDLYYAKGMKQKDIAAKMNRTQNSIEKRLRRLRERRLQRE